MVVVVVLVVVVAFLSRYLRAQTLLLNFSRGQRPSPIVI